MKDRDSKKIWQELKDKLLSEYPYKLEVARELQGSYEFGIAEQIKRTGLVMDKLDNTNEFSNLLSDLEDE
ncbi:hypothetical protein NGB25_00135 [Staphylococcus saprophyticus]|uniref:hypothetical protein n=1 Tax=Staphylococcus saprophyticus TaxID=29385 RepID=UPI002DBFC16E|nr:hypothetical protein [Staphylococcus saprophyticus]MEB7675565.1 hypothetical protein [Staphylococcus saprophyticus]